MDTLLQWNCRGLASTWPQSKPFFLLLAPIVLALQETWFLPTDFSTYSLFNYSLYRYDETNGERRHGGVALYINNDFVHDQLTLNTPLQAVACTIRLNSRKIDICSIYLPPNTDNSTLERNLTQLISQFHNPFVLLGDFNAHNPMWGRNTHTSDERGDIVERILDIHQLVLLNKGDDTYFSFSHNSESAIDLSICSPEISTLFEWSIDGDVYHSDHYPIKIRTTFRQGADDVTNFVPRWNLHKADWTKFQEFCDIDHDDVPSPEHGITFLTNTVLSAANASVPTTSPSRRRKTVPWWSLQVAQAIAKRKRAFRKYLRNRDNASLIERNKERASCKKIIREAKRSSWQSFISQLNFRTPLSKIWSIVRSLSGKQSFFTLPVLRVNNCDIIEPQQIVDTIASTFARCSSSENYRPGFVDLARRDFRLPPNAFLSDNTEVYNSPFSFHELQEAISSTGCTSVGPDNLHYAFFRHLPESTLRFMLRTLNDLWQNHNFPAAWREAVIIPILKPGKNRKDPSSYRPISLTSCFGKIFERMVSKRLNWFVEEHNIISKYQSGFRKYHTTYDHIIRLETAVRKGFKFKKHTTAVFLDIARAYDMVYKPILLYKIHQIGIRGHLAHYLFGFLRGTRNFRVRCRSILSNTFSFGNGLPQGSCLSPMLFNIMINDLFDTIPPGISYSLFADDCAIWCTDSDSAQSIPRLQQALNRIEVWSHRNGCTFSPVKSAVMTFTKLNPMRQAPSLYLSGNVIPRVDSFKFLGVVLDPRLSMAKHIQHIKNKCTKRLNLFRCIAGTDFGADRKTLLHLYKALVLPIIEYGAVIYAGASDNTLKPLDTLQNTFIRIATGAMRTSPIPSLQVEALIPPLHFRRMEQSLRYVSKVQFHPSHNTFQAIHVLPSIHHHYVGPAEKRSGLTIASRVKKFSADMEYSPPKIQAMPKLKFPTWQQSDRMVSFLFDCSKTNMTFETTQQTFLKLRARFSTFHFLYTDGSKDGDRTSSAVYAKIQRRIVLQARLPIGTSVFLAELYAVFKAMKLIQEKTLHRTVICSDSRSVITSLRSHTPCSPLHVSIYNLHHELAIEGLEIHFLWIPGHCGIYGNIQADKYAKDALRLENITEIPIAYSSIKTSLRQAVVKTWQKQWSNTNHATQLRRIKPTIQMWSSANRPNRTEERVLCRLRLGHTMLTHGFRYSGHLHPICDNCLLPQTVEHFIIACPKYLRERTNMVQFCNKENIPFDLATILGDMHSALHSLLISFLRDTELFDKL